MRLVFPVALVVAADVAEDAHELDRFGNLLRRPILQALLASLGRETVEERPLCLE